MKLFRVVFAILLASALLHSQAASTSPQTGSIAHGSFPARILKTLDSSKLKDDDSIEVEVIGAFKLADGTLVAKGSKMTGRVTLAKARSKGDPDSQLSLAFDKLNIAGGKQLAIKGEVQALYPPAEEGQGPNMATAGTSAGGAVRGAGSGGIGLTDANAGSNTEKSDAQVVMDMKASGVQGMHDLSLDHGVLSSKGKSVKLGSGVRIVVRADVLL